ncbi:MAG TPA: hypothetical protein VH475_07420 [Tepidisphaeraceae bacterium]
MSKSKFWIVFIAASLAGLAPFRACAQDQGASTAASTEAATAPSPELAVRYASLAQETLRQKVVLNPHFKQAAAFLMAAARLDPTEPRYPRMLYEAMLQLHDLDGALEAIKAYRAVNQQSADDQLAMVNYIDLSATRLQTAEARLEHYRKLLASRAPDPVKSHCAFRASQVARERGELDLEGSLLEQSLKLNPVNLDALRARLERQSNGDDPDAKPADRVGTLLAMVKSNPVQPMVTYRVAREIADAGMPEESLRYYTLSVNLATSTGTAMGREFALGYASELYLMGQPQLLAVTRTIVEQLLKQDGGDVESLLLRWLSEKGTGDKDAAAKTARQIVNASLNRVLTLRQRLGVTGPGATTRPVDSPDLPAIPDLSPDIAKLNADPNLAATLHDPYAQAVSDLAWYLVYVADQPAESTRLLPTLKALLSEKDPLVVRIEGWNFLVQDKLNEAGVKFRAVADQDVLAQAGVDLLWAKNPAEKSKANDAAARLIQQHPSGLLAAVLVDTLHDLSPKVTPRDDAKDIKDALAAFPRDWLKIIDPAAAKSGFYTLRAEMANNRILFPFGEPMVATVSIKNISQYDITIGPEGVIRNDLWFDAQLRGLVQQMITGAAYERIGQVLVLKPGQTISQNVRLDQGQLAQVLNRYPNPTLSFYGLVRTNPRGDGGSGPCGYGVPFSSITERTGFPLNENALRALSNLVASGTVPEKMRSLELMAAEVEQLRTQQQQQQNNPQQAAQINILITSFLEAMNKAASDPSPAVATWGSFLAAAHDQTKVVPMRDRLLADADPTRRLIGMMIAGAMPLDDQKKLVANILKDDKDPMVHLYAAGMNEIAQIAAQQPATTMPTTAPTVAPIPALTPTPIQPTPDTSPNK